MVKYRILLGTKCGTWNHGSMVTPDRPGGADRGPGATVRSRLAWRGRRITHGRTSGRTAQLLVLATAMRWAPCDAAALPLRLVPRSKVPRRVPSPMMSELLKTNEHILVLIKDWPMLLYYASRRKPYLRAYASVRLLSTHPPSLIYPYALRTGAADNAQTRLVNGS